MAKVPTDKMLHFIVSLLLAIVASTIIANAIYNIMPDNPGARTATAYGAALFATLAIGVWKESRDRKQAGRQSLLLERPCGRCRRCSPRKPRRICVLPNLT